MKSYDNFRLIYLFNKSICIEINRDLDYLKFVYKDNNIIQSDKSPTLRKKIKLEDVGGIIDSGEKTSSVELKQMLYDN